MPMYEYRCEGCEQIIEVRQRFSDAPLTTCETCGAPLKKLISQTGFALKGGGWYQQGYSEAPSSASACPGAGPSGCAGCPKAVNE